MGSSLFPVREHHAFPRGEGAERSEADEERRHLTNGMQ